MRTRWGIIIGVLVLAFGCAKKGPAIRSDVPTTPSSSGTERVTEPPARSAESKVDEKPRAFASNEELPSRPTEQELFGERPARVSTVNVTTLLAAAKMRGISPRSDACLAWTTRAAAPRRVDLTTALATKDAAARDALLVAMSPADRLLIAALRAELAPIECADAITDREIPPSATVVHGEAADVVVGYSIAAKLARSTDVAAVDALKTALTALKHYAWAIALIESGLADHRLSSEGSARRLLARDAILTAFDELAAVGALHNARAAKARSLLRLDALDDLLLPAWTPTPPGNDDERALVNCSPYWFGMMPEKFRATDSLVPALAAGVPIRACKRLECEHYARARLDLGRLFWRRVDFVEAAHAADLADMYGDSAVDRLYLALALDLARGPVDATDVIARRGAPDLATTPALDAFAKTTWTTAAMAAYDAAVLRSLAVPEDATAAAYREDVAKRFEEAASRLADPAHRKRALMRANEMRGVTSRGGL